MKKIIITGSSSGFGLKAAKDFADKGNRVFAAMRNPNGKNAKGKEELESHSNNIKVVDMDVTSDVSVKEGMASILAETGNIDIFHAQVMSGMLSFSKIISLPPCPLTAYLQSLPLDLK